MIIVDHTALPYLFTGSILGAATVITFFKGANEFITCFTQNSECKNGPTQTPSSSTNAKCQKIFKSLAWMGTSLLAGYGCYEIQKSFLDVRSIEHTTFDPQVYQKDLDEYQPLSSNQWIERVPLKNFCLSYLQSAEAFSSLNKQPSFFQIKADPNIGVAQSAHKAILRVEREFQALKDELEERLGVCETDFSNLKSVIHDQPIAQGVRLNFDELCETPFSFLSSNLCRRYQKHKSYLDQYQQILSGIDDYKKEILNEKQYERCREIYAIHPAVRRIPTQQDLDQHFSPPDSEGILSRISQALRDLYLFTF